MAGPRAVACNAGGGVRGKGEEHRGSRHAGRECGDACAGRESVAREGGSQQCWERARERWQQGAHTPGGATASCGAPAPLLQHTNTEAPQRQHAKQVCSRTPCAASSTGPEGHAPAHPCGAAGDAPERRSESKGRRIAPRVQCAQPVQSPCHVSSRRRHARATFPHGRTSWPTTPPHMLVGGKRKRAKRGGQGALGRALFRETIYSGSVPSGNQTRWGRAQAAAAARKAAADPWPSNGAAVVVLPVQASKSLFNSVADASHGAPLLLLLLLLKR